MIAAIVAIIFCVIMYKIKVLRYVLSLGISIAFAWMIWTDAHARMDNTWSIFWDNIIICDNDWTACDGI